MLDHDNVTGSGRHDLDIWHVRLANGETRALSLDELDAGFQAGWISEHTPVLRAGALRWAPLSEVAGLDATPEPIEAMPNSIAPLALDSFDVDPSDEEVNAFRPRRGRRVLGVMTALIVVAGLGYAGVRARPSVQRALASRSASVQPVPAPPAPLAPAPLAAAPPPAPVATMVASALPNATPTVAPAPKAKPARAVKRGAPRP